MHRSLEDVSDLSNFYTKEACSHGTWVMEELGNKAFQTIEFIANEN